MPSIFSKIITGDIPCFKIAEDVNFFAFLDINPVSKGHTLIVPKKEVDYIFDVDDSTLGAMMVFAKKVAKAMETVISCERIGVTVIGLEVPHAHIHLIPIDSLHDMDFTKKRVEMTKEEYADLAEQIGKNLI